MYISNIHTTKREWIIEGKITKEIEKDLFLWGEQEGLPVVVEVKKYLRCKENNFTLSIPISVFDEMNVENEFRVFLCHNYTSKMEVTIEEVLTDYASVLNNDGLYSYELSVVSGKISICVKKKRLYIAVTRFQIKANRIEMEMSLPQNLLNKSVEVEVLIGRRFSEQLWEYKDKWFLLGRVENGRLKSIIPTECLKEPQNQYFDFIVRLHENNKKADYLLYEDCIDEIHSLVYQKKESDGKEYFFRVYRSGGRNLSVEVKSESYIACVLKKMYLSEDNVSIRISLPKNIAYVENCMIVVKKRLYSMYGQYCDEWRYEMHLEGRECFFDIRKSVMMGGRVKGKDEFWDVFVCLDGIEYPVYSNEDYKTDYFGVDNGCKICLFMNGAKFLSVYTHDGEHAEKNKIKIAVLGTCFTRSVFKSDPYFNPCYKRLYECVYTQYHSSIISMTSKRCKSIVYQENEFDKEGKRYLPTEFAKDFFERFRESGAKYLLLDNYVDATRPIIEIEKDVFLSYNKYYYNNNIVRQIAGCRMIKPGTNEYYALYRKHAQSFLDQMKKYIPENHIFLLQGRFSYSVIDEKSKKVEAWPGKQSLQMKNMCWDKTDGILRELAPEMRIIDMRNTQYVSDKNSPIQGGASPSHYQKSFYRDILNRINEFVLEDKLN